MIILQQAFYGRDLYSGYRLLASTDTRHNKVIERLCASIGTPVGNSIVDPFYINYIENGYRYMIRAVNGNIDDSGRKTLFFHAYVGDHSELTSKKIGIEALIGANAFISQFTDTPISPLNFEECSYTVPWENTKFHWNNEKIAIVCDHQKLNLICGILRNAINVTNWASFSFRPLNDFKLYAISKYAALLPDDRKCIDEYGNVYSGSSKPDDENIKNDAIPIQEPKRKVNKLLLSLSLLFLLSISIVINVFWLLKKPEVKEKVVEKIVIKEVPVDRQQVISELRNKFGKNNIIYGNFSEEIRKDPPLKIQYDKHKKEILIKAGAYVDFVNKYILKEETKNEHN